MPYYNRLNIKDDGDNDFDINFPEKNLTAIQTFLLSNRKTKKDVTNALNSVKGKLEMVKEEKPKGKKKAKFTDNVNKMFSEIRKIVINEATKDEKNKIKLSIPNVSTIFFLK